ncbi:hypothetical protein AMELA_G00088070 [Ameiurus melas]|uniref:Uncharacterized protein n=1 Tax=Ameiurus melas TaxID=219545 RepID=A0A7J6AVP3_AMEME|nr:hypothetical protein AMELA_G00088070 [Ameiurus melas]
MVNGLHLYNTLSKALCTVSRSHIEPPTLRLVDNSLYHLSHSCPMGSLELIPGNMGHRSGDTLDGMPTHSRSFHSGSHLDNPTNL